MDKPKGFGRIFNIQQRKNNIRTERLEMVESLFVIGFTLSIAGMILGLLLMILAVWGPFN